ncbi:hypothetical protein D3C72_2143680 [compost metagenome]
MGQALAVKLLPFPVARLDIGVHQIGLGREVVVEAHLGDARMRGDCIDAGGTDPISIEQFGRGLQQALARRRFLAHRFLQNVR